MAAAGVSEANGTATWAPSVGDIVRDGVFAATGIVAFEATNEWGRYVGVYYVEIDDFILYARPGYSGEALRHPAARLEYIDRDDCVARCEWSVVRKARAALVAWLAPASGEGARKG
jgi:hypothetical protein